MIRLLTFLVLLLLAGCIGDAEDDRDFPDSVEGMRPVYLEGQDWQAVIAKPAQPIARLGKMYYKDNHLFVVESNRGIHVFDNANPANPEAIGFIEIWGCNDVAIKGHILYADNITDLVAVDISDLDSLPVVSRTPDIYPDHLQHYPEAYSGYFECVDPSKGKVIGWETATLTNPKCRR